jgi:hypothetical protein
MYSITVSTRFPFVSIQTLIVHRTKKTKDETFDPQLVAAVEAKLRYLDVDTDALYSDFEAAR